MSKRSHDQITMSYIEAQRRKSSKSDIQPRWHNQAFMLYLALRQHSENTMPRTDLIKTALAIDKQISQEHLIPKVFRGKTPMNSASAILTNNADRYFVPFKPEGSRSMHFKLAFDRPSFDTCFREYQLWQDNLAKYDWPCHFEKKASKMSIENIVDSLEVKPFATEFDEFIANRRRQERLLPSSWKDVLQIKHDGRVFATRNLPKNIPLGFYFGVPMSEDEFDALKQHKPAARYAYMYRKSTVIDPTDNQGELYKDICPFYHLGQTSIPEKANVIFYEGQQKNQIVCWTTREVLQDQELLMFAKESHTPFYWKNTHYKEIMSANTSKEENTVPIC